MPDSSMLAWLKHFGFVWIADCSESQVSSTVEQIKAMGRYIDVQTGPPQDPAPGLTGIYGMPRQDSSS